MRLSRIVLMLTVVLALGACSSKFKRYYGPEVTRVVVYKAERKMYLMHHDEVLRTYDIELGFTPEGHKAKEGDGRTPEGRYTIDRRNPDSKFHLSLGISYPNEQDVEVAKDLGVSPGGDIFIHGGPRRKYARGGKDWTAGCIAVRDKDIEWIYAMVGDGTVIDIYPQRGWQNETDPLDPNAVPLLESPVPATPLNPVPMDPVMVARSNGG